MLLASGIEIKRNIGFAPGADRIPNPFKLGHCER
jgi:hypothetical protein